MEPTVYPVDKGWSWIIMFGSFIVHVFSMGYDRSFGILYVEFQEKFNCSSTLISTIIGIKSVLYCLTAVLVMNLALKKISVRTSCMIGCVFQSLSVAANSTITDPVYLILTQGVFYGIGHAMLYCPMLYILSQYFHRYRPLTTALASCGSGIGGIVFPFITRQLIDYFGLYGALMILGSLMLHQLIAVTLFTPPDDYKATAKSLLINDGSAEMSDNSSEQFIANPPSSKNRCNGSEVFEKRREPSKLNADVRPDNAEDCFRDVKETCTFSNGNVSNSHHLYVNIPRNKDDVNLKSTNSPLLRKALLSSQPFSSGLLTPFPARQSKSNEFLNTLRDSTNGLNQIHTSMPSILLIDDSCSPRQQSRRNGGTKHYTHEGNGDLTEMESLTKTQLSSHSSSTMDCSRFRLVFCSCPAVMHLASFWVLLIYFVGCVAGVGCTPIYIPALALENGLSRAVGDQFLMTSASVDIAGRFLPGFVLHFRCLRPTQFMMVPTSCLAIIYLLTPLFHDFTSLMILSLSFGLLTSSFWAVQTLVIIEVLGMEHLASAIGLYAVCMGLSSSVSFPFGGWLRDVTGSYSYTFVFLGVMYLIAVASLVVLQLLRCQSPATRMDKDNNDTGIEKEDGNDYQLDAVQKPQTTEAGE